MERIHKFYNCDNDIVYVYKVESQDEVDRLMYCASKGKIFKGYRGISGGYNIPLKQYEFRVSFKRGNNHDKS